MSQVNVRYAAQVHDTVLKLRSGELDLIAFVEDICDRIDAIESQVQALVPEPDRRSRLIREATALGEQFPDPASRPKLYGIPVGVKDIFHVDGFDTQAGSNLPANVLTGDEAICVRRLREAGALILGKTVTTEFAYFEPGPTRNPHNLAHTPGGSSSGSAVAVVTPSTRATRATWTASTPRAA